MFASTETLGDIAIAAPIATRVFLRHKLDFCCGGKRTLAQACDKAGLDIRVVQQEIVDETYRNDDIVRWEDRPLSELAAHIEDHYHEALRLNVPPLIAAAQRVEKVHSDKPAVPKGLAKLLSSFWDDMKLHMEKEETILFPMALRGVRGRDAYMPVRVLLGEHEEHGRTLVKIRELTNGFVVPTEACATWKALYEGLLALEVELMQHIHLENHLLFPRLTGRSDSPM